MSNQLRRDRRATRKATMADNNTDPGRPAVSSTVVLIVVGVLLLVGLGGAVLIHLIRPDASATYTQTVLQFLGFLTTVLTIVYAVNKVSGQVGQVQKQTNGTLSALREEVARKEDVIQRLHVEKTDLARQLPPTE